MCWLSACNALLYQLVRTRLFTCLFLQHASMWKHASFWWQMHRLHNGDLPFLALNT